MKKPNYSEYDIYKFTPGFGELVDVGDRIAYLPETVSKGKPFSMELAYGKVTYLFSDAVEVEDYDGTQQIIKKSAIRDLGRMIDVEDEELDDEFEEDNFYPLYLRIADGLSSIMPIEFWVLMPIAASLIIAILHYT